MYCANKFNIKKFTLCPYFIFMFCIYLKTNTINWLIFITEIKSVYSEVRTETLNKAVCTSAVKG
jgi:hypothetical protein